MTLDESWEDFRIDIVKEILKEENKIIVKNNLNSFIDNENELRSAHRVGYVQGVKYGHTTPREL